VPETTTCMTIAIETDERPPECIQLGVLLAFDGASPCNPMQPHSASHRVTQLQDTPNASSHRFARPVFGPVPYPGRAYWRTSK